MARRWKPVVGYKSYQVSDDGLVVRVLTYGRKPKPTWKMVAKRVKRDGYVTYHLCENGERKDPLAHRLAWEAFNGPIAEGFEINHKNGNKEDNRLVNLEAVTRSENMKHKFRVLRHAAPDNPSPGSRNGSAKLTETDIPKIIEMLAAGMYQYEVAKIFGVTQRAIGRIALGQGWKQALAKIPTK
jgi:hypothetical protein